MRRLTTEEFIEKSKLIHGDLFDYSQTIHGKNQTVPVTLFCNNHNGFIEQTPRDNLNGRGCKQCGVAKRAKDTLERKSTEFIERAIAIHGDSYGYDQFVYEGCMIKSKIWRNSHKDFFYQEPTIHLRGHGCLVCNRNGGKAERELYEILATKFGDICTISGNTRPAFLEGLEYDITLKLPDNSLVAIEYDGHQHFEPRQFGGIDKSRAHENFVLQQARDSKKNTLSKLNNVKLIRIAHFDYEKNPTQCVDTVVSSINSHLLNMRDN